MRKRTFLLPLIFISNIAFACPDGYECVNPDVSEWKYGAWSHPSGAYAESQEDLIADLIESISLRNCNISYIPGGGRYLNAGEPDPGCQGGLTPSYLGTDILQCNTAIESFQYANKANCSSQNSTTHARLFRKRDVACPQGYNAYQGFCAKYIYPTIRIIDPSTTKSLPASDGPIEIKIIVERNGELLKNHQFGISISGGGELSSITNNEGYGEFLYVPPYMNSVSAKITATCRICINNATHYISVMNSGNSHENICYR